jgi:glycosyltransferase involved in cell wall biosynthesis
LRTRQVDILHTHLFDPSVVGLTAGALARTPVRTMTRHYSDYHTRIQKRWHVRLDQLCTALCHRVIAVSEHTAEVMRGEEGAPAGRVRVILNGIDFERVRLSTPKAPQALRRQFAPNGEFLLLQVARLHPEKGHEHLFRALAAIRARAARPVRLLVAGSGSFEAEYRRQVRELGVEEMVVFTGFRRDIPDLMAAADVLVLPSVAEAFGLVLAEALYLGTPVVASRVGGIPEIVRDGVDGLLVPPGSPEALAQALLEVSQDEGLRQRLAGAGRERMIETFRFEPMMRRYEALYQEMLVETAHISAPRLGRHPHI